MRERLKVVSPPMYLFNFHVYIFVLVHFVWLKQCFIGGSVRFAVVHARARSSVELFRTIFSFRLALPLLDRAGFSLAVARYCVNLI